MLFNSPSLSGMEEILQKEKIVGWFFFLFDK